MLRIADLFKRKEPLPFHEIAAGGLSLRIYEHTCGHLGYAAELFAPIDDDESVLIGVVAHEDLQHSIMLLQEGMAVVNDRAMAPRLLQTTWLRGAIYYVDERLGELRKKDDPSDRIRLETA